MTINEIAPLVAIVMPQKVLNRNCHTGKNSYKKIVVDLSWLGDNFHGTV
jgi:hypothetical protein